MGDLDYLVYIPDCDKPYDVDRDTAERMLNANYWVTQRKFGSLIRSVGRYVCGKYLLVIRPRTEGKR